ncbi:MAG: ribbon-helix-helix domain-containing protein [Myxococcota bacterium]
MTRTVISLEDADKEWLDRRANEEGVPMTELVRRAVRLLKEQTPVDERSRVDLLAATRGIWKQGEGLAYQERLRADW